MNTPISTIRRSPQEVRGVTTWFQTCTKDIFWQEINILWVKSNTKRVSTTMSIIYTMIIWWCWHSTSKKIGAPSTSGYPSHLNNNILWWYTQNWRRWRTTILNWQRYSNTKGYQREIPTRKLIQKGTSKGPQNRRMTTSMLGRNSLPKKAKMRWKVWTTKLTTGVSVLRHD